MLAADHLRIIGDCARDFDAEAVWLFGSSLGQPSEAADIDLAVEGVAPEQFFKFYFRLIMALPRPVDLVDLSLDPPIAAIVREKGMRIYERSSAQSA